MVRATSMVLPAGVKTACAMRTFAQASSATTAISRRTAIPAWAALAALALIAVAGLFWTLGRRAPKPFEELVVPAALSRRPITASGLVISAAISPDGKYVSSIEVVKADIRPEEIRDVTTP